MKPRPTIFLSGVSSEFASFREAVEVEIQKKGCFVDNQPSFATDYRTIEAMLRQKLSEADAVIHIVGFRYGAEPHARPADAARRSYTQMEYDIARELQKPLYVFLSDSSTVRDPTKPDEKPEDLELSALQEGHRDSIRATDHLYYVFKDKDELSRLGAAIPTIAAVGFHADISRIDKYAPGELIGREKELALLDDAWLKVRRAETPRTHVITFVALGGEGKTSLIAKWAAELAHHGWPGCDAAFAWSFYSQGAREQFTSSSDLFLKEAITFFGDEADREFAASSAGAYEKGQRLARILKQRQNLLILDGLEPLQYSPTPPTAGELKDPGIAALLKGLAVNSKGLCIVTTRYSVPDLKTYWQTTALEVKVNSLSRDAGVHLLKLLGVTGSLLRNIPFNDGQEQVNEFEKLVEDVRGHALTLNLLGTYLRDAHAGDIRRRDLVKLEEADAEEQSGHAFRVMEAYTLAFESEGEKGKRTLATLRLLGLFDRPMSADLWIALLQGSPIPDLTEPLIGTNEAQHNLVFKRLEDARLITINRDGSRALISVDAHPLLREYLARQLRTRYPESWRAAHRRIYEHLCANTPEMPEPTLQDLQPLYQAVAHGCQADLHEEALDVYYERIYRFEENYSMRRLGAFGSELGAIRCFFESPWSQVSSLLSASSKSWILAVAAFALHGMGRLVEAVQLTRGGMPYGTESGDSRNAAVTFRNLSDLQLTIGQVAQALKDAELAVTYADKSDEMFLMMATRTGVADVLYQRGRYADAKKLFHKAEQMQAARQPHYRLLYGFQGFRYCDLLLFSVERAAWKRTLELSQLAPRRGVSISNHLKLKALKDVSRRAGQTLEWAKFSNQGSLISIALDQLTLVRTKFYQLVFRTKRFPLETDTSELKDTIDAVLAELRNAGRQDLIPRGLLIRAWFQSVTASPHSAAVQEDLDEAWEIAERGPMRLHMADIHLYRARLFFREKEYPWESARTDLEAAERLINECGYHRRDEELADAKRAILGI